jgi:hypothetical protein
MTYGSRSEFGLQHLLNRIKSKAVSVYIQVDLSGFKVNQGLCRVAVLCRLISPNEPSASSDFGC